MMSGNYKIGNKKMDIYKKLCLTWTFIFLLIFFYSFVEISILNICIRYWLSVGWLILGILGTIISIYFYRKNG